MECGVMKSVEVVEWRCGEVEGGGGSGRERGRGLEELEGSLRNIRMVG
jgi:hypothetical protein